MDRRTALWTIGIGAAAVAGAGWISRPAVEDGAQPAPRASRRRVRVCYTEEYVGAAMVFETTRKARWVARSLAAEPIVGIQVVANEPLSAAQVERVHEPAYVAAVRSGQPRALAESQGFSWDPQLWRMVLASNGGACAAAAAALTDGIAGSLSSGLHHARRDRGNGFCTFNGLVIAARQALDRGAKRILILDLDAHCGGGTHSLLGEHPAIRQLDVAVDAFDHYSPSGANTLDLVSVATDYLATVERRLDALDGTSFDLCLYNAGMDPHEGSPVGGLAGIDHELLGKRERMVFDWCRSRRLPVAFVLAGGYIGAALDEAGLVALHRLTLAAAVG